MNSLPDFQNRRYPARITAAAIFLLGFLVYANTFHASFHLDDEQNIITNFAIRHLWNLKEIWAFLPTRFVTYLSLAFNYQLHQLSLPGYHIFNLAVHLGAAILVSWFVLLLFSTPALKEEKISNHNELLALIAGLIFVSHPIQTQAVTYIIQRTASLAAFFYLLSVCLYLKSRLSQPRFSTSGLPRGSAPRNDLVFMAGSVLAAIAALFTKETAVTLPFMLLLCDLSFFPNSAKNTIKRLAPFFFVLVAFLIVFHLTGPGRISEIRNLKEVQPGLTVITPTQYLLTEFRVIVTYLRLLFIPINQNLDYDYPIAKTLWTVPTFSSLLFLLAILAGAVLLFRKRRLISFGVFWFFIALIPESSILPIRDVIFEHRLYLPMIGFSLFLPVALYYMCDESHRYEKQLKLMAVVLFVIIAYYSVMTYSRNRVWKDEITLWSDVIKKSPNKARPYSNRSFVYATTGEYEKALADSNQAVKLSPGYAVAYCNRAAAYYCMGQYDLAVADYARAITLEPTLSDAYFNRAFAYEKKKEYDQAISDWSVVLKLNPNDADASFNRERMYVLKGEYDQAVKTVPPPPKVGAFDRR